VEAASVNGARTWRFGVVGTGAMSATMMDCLRAERRVDVVAVASADAARAQAFAQRFQVAHAHAGLDALLARDDVDAVYIATATRDHAAHAIAALEAGKAVLCEKPFAIGVAQGQHVLAAAQRTGRLFMEAQWTTALPAYRELLRLVRERSLGEPVLLHSEFGIAHDPAAHPRLFQGPGAGVLLDFGVYPIVLALQAFGPVRSVDAAVRCNAAGVDVHATLQLTHELGGHSQLAASLVATLPNRSSLSCAGGHVVLDSPVMGAETLGVRHVAPAGPVHAAAGGARQSLVAALRRQRWLRRLKASLGGGASEHPFGANRYAPQLSHFVALLDAGALESDLMPHATSLAVLRVVEAARRCSPTAVEVTP